MYHTLAFNTNLSSQILYTQFIYKDALPCYGGEPLSTTFGNLTPYKWVRVARCFGENCCTHC
jgi:hypothetical protein